MKTTTKFIIAGLVLTFSLGGGSGSKAGMWWQRYVDEKEAVFNRSGHYDQLTGNFEWGKPADIRTAAIAAAVDEDKLQPPEGGAIPAEVKQGKPHAGK